MRNISNRRSFFQRSLLALAGLGCLRGAGLAVEPFQRAGGARFRLSLAAYSFRDYFQHGTQSAKVSPSGKKIDLFQFIDFCADHGCDAAEPTSYYFPPDVNPEFLLKLKRHAFLRGLEISGTAVGNNFTLPLGARRDAEIQSVKKWIGYASILGAPHIRVFAGPAPKDLSRDEAKKLCLAALEECAEEAAKYGVFLGLENHGGIVAEADDLLELVRATKSPWVGINLDTGNFSTADPYGDLARCAPYSVNVQFKAEIKPKGEKAQPADLPRLVKILKDANYQGYVALEYESAEDPWTAVPRLLREIKAQLTAA